MKLLLLINEWKLCRPRRPLIRRAQTTDLRILGVDYSDSYRMRQKQRANSDDEEVPSSRVATTATVNTFNRPVLHFVHYSVILM